MEEPSVNTPRSSGQSTSLTPRRGDEPEYETSNPLRSLTPRRGDEPEYETSNPLASHPGEEMSPSMRRALH